MGPVCAFNEQLNDDVLTAANQKFYLLAVVRQTHADASRECFDALNSRPPIRERIIDLDPLNKTPVHDRSDSRSK